MIVIDITPVECKTLIQETGNMQIISNYYYMPLFFCLRRRTLFMNQMFVLDTHAVY